MSTTQPIKSVKQLEQFKKYYQEVSPDSRNYALIILGLNTALRISDILRLHIADVWDFRQHCFNRHIEIAEKKNREKYFHIYKPGGPAGFIRMSPYRSGSR